MKTENTCINCAILECGVRRECEDNELPIDACKPETEEEAEVTFRVMLSKPEENVIGEKRSW